MRFRQIVAPMCTVLFVGALAWRASSVSPGSGDPIGGLTPAQQALFSDGKADFESVETVTPDGLGPVFNGTSCAGCHSTPATGGASTTVETRFGRILNGKFDPMSEFGGSLIQTTGTGPQGSCDFVGETVPPEATIVAHRLTTPLFGLGLVDAVPDDEIKAIALIQKIFSPSTAGKVAMVTDLASSHLKVGKFGWKCQNPNLHQFAGDAYVNEMGITNPQFPQENCPQGDCNLLVCNPVPTLNDDGSGVTKFTNFMTFLAPLPRGPVNDDVRHGEALFFTTGCFACHTPALQTGNSSVAALRNVTFFPFSDFLLHDMGSLGDGIEQGPAKGTDMRTAPLWGVRARATLLHDGRATTLEQAILAHAGQGQASRNAFASLGSHSKAQLIAFLNSL
jgi:CxxC motif-containing protein (DUF1111 family)